MNDKEYNNCVNNSLNLIKNVINDYDISNCAISFNGGKDCTVLLHIIRMALNQNNKSLNDIYTIYFQPAKKGTTTKIIDDWNTYNIKDELVRDNNQLVFAEVEEFMNNIVSKYELKFILVRCDTLKNGLIELLKLYKIDAIFMGQRRIDPHAQHIDQIALTDESSGWPKVLRVNAILEWSYAFIWQFLKQHQLEYCILYDLGYTSLGAPSNTKPNPALWNEATKSFNPAYILQDGNKERLGREK